MMKILRNNLPHIVIWGLMFLYVFKAPRVYALIKQRIGIPTRDTPGFFVAEPKAKYTIDSLDLIVRDGEEYYFLWGWAFLLDDPRYQPDYYYNEVVLMSASNYRFFATDVLERPGVHETFSYLGLDLVQSGFSALIAKNSLPVGTHQIGILFKSQSDGTEYLVKTNKAILRTPNHLKLIDFNPGS